MKTLIASCAIAVLVIAAFVAAGKISRRATEPAGSKVDKEFAEWDRKDAPGCSVAAARNGVILYERVI